MAPGLSPGSGGAVAESLAAAECGAFQGRGSQAVVQHAGGWEQCPTEAVSLLSLVCFLV